MSTTFAFGFALSSSGQNAADGKSTALELLGRWRGRARRQRCLQPTARCARHAEHLERRRARVPSLQMPSSAHMWYVLKPSSLSAVRRVGAGATHARAGLELPAAAGAMSHERHRNLRSPAARRPISACHSRSSQRCAPSRQAKQRIRRDASAATANCGKFTAQLDRAVDPKTATRTISTRRLRRAADTAARFSGLGARRRRRRHRRATAALPAAACAPTASRAVVARYQRHGRRRPTGGGAGRDAEWTVATGRRREPCTGGTGTPARGRGRTRRGVAGDARPMESQVRPSTRTGRRRADGRGERRARRGLGGRRNGSILARLTASCQADQHLPAAAVASPRRRGGGRGGPDDAGGSPWWCFTLVGAIFYGVLFVPFIFAVLQQVTDGTAVDLSAPTSASRAAWLRLRPVVSLFVIIVFSLQSVSEPASDPMLLFLFGRVVAFVLMQQALTLRYVLPAPSCRRCASRGPARRQHLQNLRRPRPRRWTLLVRHRLRILPVHRRPLPAGDAVVRRVPAVAAAAPPPPSAPGALLSPPPPPPPPMPASPARRRRLSTCSSAGSSYGCPSSSANVFEVPVRSSSPSAALLVPDRRVCLSRRTPGHPMPPSATSSPAPSTPPSSRLPASPSRPRCSRCASWRCSRSSSTAQRRPRRHARRRRVEQLASQQQVKFLPNGW